MKSKFLISQYSYFIFLSFIIISSGCDKAWLDVKPDQSLVVPSTIKDMQSLLDNTDFFNSSEPVLGEQGSDDYYISSTFFSSLTERSRNIYIWKSGNIFEGTGSISDWTGGYRQVYYSNNVLEGIDKISVSSNNETSWKNVKGSALFYRAYAFYNLAQVFCKPYVNLSADSDLGIILRVNSNINTASKRATVRETYDQIISDLKASLSLLPASPLYKTRPSKPASLAMLARVYLCVGSYDSSWRYADSCLRTYGTLMDYNNYTTGTNPFPLYNPEVLYHSKQPNSSLLPQNSNGSGIVDSVLYRSYSSHDLRKTAFFKQVSGQIKFSGSYNGTGTALFDGLAVDEVYLIRAECYARNRQVSEALRDLNTLMEKRWERNFFIPIVNVSVDDALSLILLERRKELCFRNLRWTDLRRLNNEKTFAKPITRLVNQILYTLPPGDDRYVYPFPDNEVLYSTVPQNMR